MAEDQKGGEISQDKLTQGFGIIIAYICPGFLTLVGLQERFPSVKAWLGTAAAANAQAGSFLFAVMIALATSMLLWSLGSFLIEDLLAGWFKWIKLPEQTVSLEEIRKQPGAEAAYRDLRDQHYRYYQFHASMVVSLPIIYWAWIDIHSFSNSWPTTIVSVIIEFVLGRNAYSQLKRYRERREKLLH